MYLRKLFVLIILALAFFAGAGKFSGYLVHHTGGPGGPCVVGLETEED